MNYTTLIFLFTGCVIAQLTFVLITGKPIEKAVNAILWQATAYVTVAVVMWMESL